MTTETSLQRPKRRKPTIACPNCRLHGETFEDATPTRTYQTITVYNDLGVAIARARGYLCSTCKAGWDYWNLLADADAAEEHADDMEREAQQLQDKADRLYDEAEEARRGSDRARYEEARLAWDDAQQDADEAAEEADRAASAAYDLRTKAGAARRAPPDCHQTKTLRTTARGRGGRAL
jgi:hypothetical protein